MKKIILMLVIAFAIIVANADATCPTGYDNTTVQMSIFDCTYNVDICYKCTPQGIVQGWASVYGFEKADTSCIHNPQRTSNEIFNRINEILLSYDFLLSLCSITAPPCSTNTYIYWEISEQICWYKTKIGGKIKYEPCIEIGDLYCLTVYKICWNNYAAIYEINHGPQVNGELETCPDTIPLDPPPGQSSGCFRLNTDCTY